MAISKVFHAATEGDLDRIARTLAPLLPHGRIISLEGNLGAGKTAFARALIRNLSGAPDLDVPSPTYTLVQTYDTSAGTVWHLDLYRLKSADELYELGWEEALSGAALVLVEWAEKAAALMPHDMARIIITPQPDGSRSMEVSA